MYGLPLFNEPTGCVVFYIVRDEGLCESGRGQSSHGGPKEQHRDEWNAHYAGCERASFSHRFLVLIQYQALSADKGSKAVRNREPCLRRVRRSSRTFSR